MRRKTFNIGYYLSNARDEEDEEVALFDLLMAHCASNNGLMPAITMEDMVYFIRDLKKNDKRNIIRGVFAKIRRENLPHIGEESGNERIIDVVGNEGLIEKNHFLLYKRFGILVYQKNRDGSSITRMGRYLSQIEEEKISFDAILQPDAMRRFLKGDVELRAIDLSVAKPKSGDWYPSNEWNQDIMDLLSRSDGAKIRVTVRAERKSKHRMTYLRRSLKSAVKELIRHADVKRASISVVEDEIEHPIDLIGDRLISSVSVEMVGRYPNSSSMYQELAEAKRSNNAIFKDLFENSD